MKFEYNLFDKSVRSEIDLLTEFNEIGKDGWEVIHFRIYNSGVNGKDEFFNIYRIYAKRQTKVNI